MKRLFLFAFYDPQGVVGEAALRYLEALRPLGEVVLATDCDLQPGEADKPYDEARLHEICAPALFQKTDYKSNAARSPLQGSFADILLAPYR